MSDLVRVLHSEMKGPIPWKIVIKIGDEWKARDAVLYRRTKLKII